MVRKPHKRTLLMTPPRAAERLLAAVAVAAAVARPAVIELRPLAAVATTIEQSVRIGVAVGTI